MVQQFFDARELFQTQVPYYEHDVVSGNERTMIHVGLWRAHFNLAADATLSTIRTILSMPD